MSTAAPLVNLKAMRRKRGLTQTQTARELHVPLGTYRNWEQHKCAPRSEEAQRLTEYFGCVYADLIIAPKTDDDHVDKTFAEAFDEFKEKSIIATPRDDLVRITIEGSPDAVSRILGGVRPGDEERS